MSDSISRQEFAKDTNVLTKDLIGRADAIDALGEEPEIWNDTEEEWAYRNAWVEHISAIKSLPSEDRPTGEWVRKYDKQINCYWYECNQCGEYRPRNVFGKEWSSPYCPNCGAKMVREDGEACIE